MYLPETLHHRRFTEWNYMVRGLVTVWELFRLAGMEEVLEQYLCRDQDGVLVDRLARIGNECSTIESAVEMRSKAIAASVARPVLCAVNRYCHANDPSLPCYGTQPACEPAHVIKEAQSDGMAQIRS